MDYRALAAQIAEQEGIDPNLFTRLVQQESSFRPDAVSPAGAIGLAQLMPGTARDLGVDPSDPVQNLTGGARYLRQQMDAFQDPTLALAAYNAGPGNVRKYGGVPPFEETQNYVARVLGAPSTANTTQRSQPMAQPMQTQPQPQRGILDMFGVQKMDPEAQGETALPFYQRPTFSNFMGDLALGFNQMRLRPDEGLAQRIGGRRQQREQQAQTNRTLEYLKQQPGSEAALELIRSGASPTQALQFYYQSQQPAAMDQTSAMQNFAEYNRILQSQGQEAADMFMSTLGRATNITNVLPGQEAAPQIGPIPQGFVAVLDPDSPAGYRMEVVPGGPEDISGQEIEAAQRAASSVELIDSILDDPALSAITGMVQGRLPPMTQEGTDLNVKIDQLKGQAFLQAFEILKGGGQITEREGRAATDAMARLQREQSGEEYRRSLSELRYVMDRARRRSMGEEIGDYNFAESYGGTREPSGGDVLRYNPETGEFE